MKKRIHLISGPRNISTALMYSFGNRGDCSIVDEPLYAHYLALTGKDHPGRNQILDSMQQDGPTVVKEVIMGHYPTEYVFLKNMAHHLVGMELSFLSEVSNVFLIRHPRKLIASFSKVISNPVLADIGLAHELELFQQCKKMGTATCVLDSFELLKNPEKVLRELCHKLDIPFVAGMLEWKGGPRKEDGIWAEYWYHSVHQTTSFKAQKSEDPILEEHLIPLLEEALPYYEELYDHSIKA